MIKIENLTCEEKRTLSVESNDPKILEHLARNLDLATDYVLIMNIVRNPYTSSDTLDFFARKVYYAIVLRYIARHSNTSKETLDFLAHHKDHTVRKATAENSHTSKCTRDELLKDSNFEVRCAAEDSLHV